MIQGGKSITGKIIIKDKQITFERSGWNCRCTKKSTVKVGKLTTCFCTSISMQKHCIYNAQIIASTKKRE
ncbi:hypothetical protein AGMMS50249_8180 [candidate division SR1 bacterium]|nr:hypothetical protein AGMMS50249_8180 [candidate division SR1 bacterium]